MGDGVIRSRSLWVSVCGGQTASVSVRRCTQSPVSLNGRHPCPDPEAQPHPGSLEALVERGGVGRRPVGERCVEGPVLMGRLEHHRLDVFARGVEGELGRGAAGLRRRGRDRVQLLVSSGHRRRERSRIHVLGEAERSGGKSAGGQGRTDPVVLKDLNGQRGDQDVQSVGHMGQNHLLVGIPADADVDGTGLCRNTTS